MASTSPYQHNDYQAASTFRPYTLPVNDILRANMALDNYWEQGAARIKSAYDNVLGLKLSLQPNREIRDNFMKEAEKQITKLSSMDLSDPSVQRQGLNIFKPLLQDRGVVSDDAATRHIEKVHSDALSYRTRDNGKFYSNVNHKYALDGSNEFLNATDRNAGEEYLKKRKEYEPYHDYTAEYDKILKNCPSSTNTSDSVHNGTGYIERTSEKSRSEAKVRTCMEASLSPKAYRQMQIEGYMNYKGRPEVLRDDYIDMLSAGSNNLSDEVQKLSGRRDGIAANKTMKEEDKLKITAALDAQIAALSDQVTNHTAVIKKLRSGDMSDIAGNEEGVSGALYQYRKILKESYAASFREFENTYKGDPVQMQKFGFAHAVNLENLKTQNDALLRNLDFNYDLTLQNADHLFQLQKAQIEASTKGQGSTSALIPDGKGGFTINPNVQPVTDNFTEAPTVDNAGYQNINTQLNDINTKLQANDSFLFNSFKERGDSEPAFRERLEKAFGAPWETIKATGNNFKKSDGTRVPLSQTEWFKFYMKENPKDNTLKEWSGKNSVLQLGARTLSTHIEQAEQQVANRLGIKVEPGKTATQTLSEHVRTKLPKESVKVDGKVITAIDIQDSLEGKTHKVAQIKIPLPSYGGGLSMGTTSGGEVTQMLVDGKKVNNPELEKLYMKVVGKNSEINRKVGDVRKDVYKDSQFKKDSWFFTYDDKSDKVQMLEGMFPAEKGKRGVQIEQSDFSGNYKVRIPGLGDDFKKLQGIGLGMEVTQDNPDDKDLVTVKGSTYNMLSNSLISPEMKQTAYILSSIPRNVGFQRIGFGERLKSADLDFPMFDANGVKGSLTIQVYKDSDGQPLYRIKDEKGATRIEQKDPFSVVKALQNLVTNNR